MMSLLNSKGGARRGRVGGVWVGREGAINHQASVESTEIHTNKRVSKFITKRLALFSL